MSSMESFMFSGMGSEAERRRTARHEANHAVIGWLVCFRPRLVRIGAEHGGFVDLLPDYSRRPEYCDPAFAPFPLFLTAGIDDFPGGEYAGPLPLTLPPGAARAVADIMAILLAGYAVDPGDAADNHRRGLEVEASDAQQVECLVRRYPAAGLIRDRLLGWLPSFIANLHPEVDAVANALLSPSAEAQASWISLEDLMRIRGQFNERRFQSAARMLNGRLDALAFLVERGWQDAAA